jgi:hypothetical protein
LLNTPLLQTVGNAVLGVIEPLGMMTYIMLISVEYPLNAQLFTESIFPLIAFDMVPTDDLYVELFPALDDVDDDPISETFEQIGYEAKLSINNLGSLLLFMILQPF